jgi:L-alanine-DL-glutamate epimerase-like enolase superfamily enzyme
MDMRAGTEAASGRAVMVFGEARPHHAYLFAIRRANRELFEEDLQPVRGKLTVPTAPGFGMTLNKEAEKRMLKSSIKSS